MEMIRMMVMMMMMMGVVFGSFLENTCKRTPDYNLCVSLLRSDPRSSSPDIVGYSLILIDKIKALGKETIEQIKSTHKTKPKFKHALNECHRAYVTIVDDDIQTALQAIHGDPKFAEGAVVDAGVEAAYCEAQFRKGQSPLTNLTMQMQKISDVARGIIRNLL